MTPSSWFLYLLLEEIGLPLVYLLQDICDGTTKLTVSITAIPYYLIARQRSIPIPSLGSTVYPMNGPKYPLRSAQTQSTGD